MPFHLSLDLLHIRLLSLAFNLFAEAQNKSMFADVELPKGFYNFSYVAPQMRWRLAISLGLVLKFLRVSCFSHHNLDVKLMRKALVTKFKQQDDRKTQPNVSLLGCRTLYWVYKGVKYPNKTGSKCGTVVPKPKQLYN